MIWFMNILRIYLEEQTLINYYVIKCVRYKNYEIYQGGIAPMFYRFFGKKFSCGAIKSKIYVIPAISRRITQVNY